MRTKRLRSRRQPSPWRNRSPSGLVYKTDVLSAGDTVKGVPFPESKEAINKNSIVGLKGPQAALGQEFVDLVLSSDGQKVLATAGFGPAE